MSVFILLNCKTYDEGTGANAVKLAQACRDVAENSGTNIAIAPQIPDIFRVASAVDIPVYSQHIDGAGPGSHTGKVYVRSVAQAGAAGSLINHSERRMTLADIEAAAAALKANGMTSVICTNNIAATAAAAALAPDFVAIEPPELIGSGIPVSKADPGIVTGSVDAVKKINPNVKVLCGAGISKGEDLKAALDLGAEGVLLASGIVKAKDPKEALYDLVSLI
ncbi:Triosephosphate isomerase [Methanimicrococcus sp. At1]|uniref:Triosephosphate isomerase n=1 Tax=Methanimicrococcus hacksteinii TaxID=3028293 RepID=A0ABU3VPQ4_9EURY|nr:triose-phosphate isomerase [Methanimicrococcus sp. At1]MDV0445398.1 Triosephosphate isomerase [Methanimicrococcus sp. At1]